MSISWEYVYESSQFPFVRRQGSSVRKGNWYFLCRNGHSPRIYGTGNGNARACAYILGLYKVKFVNNLLTWCLAFMRWISAERHVFLYFLMTYRSLLLGVTSGWHKLSKDSRTFLFSQTVSYIKTCMKERAYLEAKCLFCSEGNMRLICFFSWCQVL
jgi:hypothetical protein